MMNPFAEVRLSMKFALFLAMFFMPALLMGTEGTRSVAAMIVYDTAPPKTNSSYFNDARTVAKIVTSIASQTGCRLRLKLVDSKGLSESGIRKWTRASKVGSNSIFLFYYAGQGLKTQPDQLKGRSARERSFKKGHACSATEDAITAHVLSLNPRLAIFLFDTYKQFIEVPAYSVSKNPSILKKGYQTALKRLFLDTTGVVRANSASTPECAWGYKEFKRQGGLFTAKLLTSLSSIQENASWQQVMRDVSYYCRYDRYTTQSPTIKVNVTTNDSPQIVQSLDKKRHERTHH